MVAIENVYYIAMVLLALLTVLGLAKSSVWGVIRTAFNVSVRVEDSLDKIDKMDRRLGELSEGVEENNERISNLEVKIDDTKNGLSDVEDAVAALTLFRNGDLNRDKIVDDLDVDESGNNVSRYFNSEGD